MNADADYAIYDDPANSAGFTDALPNGDRRARLLIGGVHCAACTWRIESDLLREGAVRAADVNLAQQSLLVEWDPAALPLSRLFARIRQLGYEPEPWQGHQSAERMQQEQKQALKKLAVAGLAMMQVGMFGIALHAGDLQGMAAEHRALLRGVSLLVATLVVCYCAAGFFRNAWSNLRRGRLVMDLPVAIAIGLAYIASAYATAVNQGQVYFDSIAMFTFFLLLGRYLERRVRARELLRQTDLYALLPASAKRRIDGGWETVATRTIAPGDVLMVPQGALVPADGKVLEGGGSVNESAFTGEELPRAVQVGGAVAAGTVLVTGTLVIRASADSANSRLAAMMRVLARAEHQKPAIAELADRVAAWFVGGVLLATLAVGLWWWQADPGRVLWICLAVLVVSCPCALALATPTALTSAIASLRQRGLLVAGENTLERVNRCDLVLLDKTGTLTTGQFAVAQVVTCGGGANGVEANGVDEATARTLAAALEQYSQHPVASAFAGVENVGSVGNATSGEAIRTDNLNVTLPTVTDVVATPGGGVCGRVDGELLAIGSAAYIDEFVKDAHTTEPESQGAGDKPSTMGSTTHIDEFAGDVGKKGHWIALANKRGPLAWFELEDSLRPEAQETIAALHRRGYALAILSGDRPWQVARVARQLGIDAFHAGCTPADKLAHIQQQQANGRHIVMVGDGLNDAPVLAAADCAFAVNDATDLAKSRADAILLKPDLRLLLAGLDTARRTRRIILQNMAWALAYNSLALPLAAAGLVPPWAAALGMSMSSLLVVGNSLRLSRA